MALDDIIAIDGPAGSGKSTVSKKVAQRLGLTYVDTGAMYRALTLKALRKKLSLKDEKSLIELARAAAIDIVNDADSNLKVLLDDEDVTHLIRTPELTANVSYIARVKGVREQMVKTQRQIGKRGKCVFEGRDITTVVFPQARFKFYLDADFKERTRRRHKDHLKTGEKITSEEVGEALNIRDKKDMSRDIAPLRLAEDAIYIDTTNMSIEQVVDKICSYVNDKS